MEVTVKFLDGFGEAFGLSEGFVGQMCSEFVWYLREEGGCVCRAPMQHQRFDSCVYISSQTVCSNYNRTKEDPGKKHPDEFNEHGKT